MEYIMKNLDEKKYIGSFRSEKYSKWLFLTIMTLL